jgi:hypothetical protein
MLEVMRFTVTNEGTHRWGGEQNLRDEGTLTLPIDNELLGDDPLKGIREDRSNLRLLFRRKNINDPSHRFRGA